MTKCLTFSKSSCGDKIGNPCRDCNPTGFKDLEAVLTCFICKWSSALQNEWGYYRGKSISDKTLRLASRAALNESEKKHSHQFRVPNTALDEAEKIIISLKNVIQKQKNFDDLHNLIIENVENVVQGFGPLSSYDTTARIGVMLDIEPEYIYLHAGTAVGAVGIIGKDFCLGKIKLSKKDFPPEIANSKLTPDQIESFLCICKKPLNAIK